MRPAAGPRILHKDVVVIGLGAFGSAAELSTEVAEAPPGLDPRPSKAEPCVITDTPDGQFFV